MKTPTPAPEKKKNNCELARENELECLKIIGLFGWLTVRQISQFVWINSNNHTARNKAVLCLKRLEVQKLIIKRINQIGVQCYVLTRAGANFVNLKSKYLLAHHGLDLSTNMCTKQELVVNYLITKTKKGCVPFGPAALRLNVLGIRDKFDGFGNLLDGAYYDRQKDEIRGVLSPSTFDFKAITKFANAYSTGRIDLVCSHWIEDAIMQELTRIKLLQ